MQWLHAAGSPARISAVALLMLAGLVSGPALAEKPFSGEDAALIDWAWRNCKFKPTDKVRGLVAIAGREAAYAQVYTRFYQSIVAKVRGPAAIRRMCESIADDYGPLGSKFSGLLLTPGVQAPVRDTDSFDRPAPKAQDAGRPFNPGSRKGGF
jgi:hypothetical protein